MKRLTHFDRQGQARMVDVSAKSETEREAVASGAVSMNKETFEMIRKGGTAKGDVLGVARVAGIMAAKKTSEIIPMCHPLSISSVTVEFEFDEARRRIAIEAKVKNTGRTGVEMEALTAVAATALTIYDMCKAVDKRMVISDILLREKRGGKSGTFRR
ncbi:MAG: cyclic pyranopterin monophosphate synthase MoaC [Nitrospiraceae bacterium]|nr:cyclic pyranopterin monophosphate synthase MoaC [Nitrospiraceae bacterium]MDA8433321.1 cyclic pyranopterin monophosphate synthase MoaC [Nitrospiraceae bacterium]